MAEHSSKQLTPCRLPSGVPVTVTTHRYSGEKSGPLVYIQAAQHGREINGTEVLRRLHEELTTAPLAGEIITVPIADPLTFDRVSYTTPEQIDRIQPNMNRVWPGDEEGTVHERMAASLWAVAKDADVVIDLHTASGRILPHVVHTEGDDESERLAELFGTDLLLSESVDTDAREEWHARNFNGKFRVAAYRNDVPCITPELGDSRTLAESPIQLGLTGILNALRSYDMLPGEPTENGRTQKRKNHLGRVTAIESGLFRPDPDRELGETVEKGELVGHVYAPDSFEVLQEVTVDRSGILYAITEEATVTAGDRLVSVAVDRALEE